MKEIGALLVHGGEIGTDGAEGIGAVFSAEAAGNFLLDLGHADRLLGQVIGERHIVIGHEAPDVVGMGAQTPQEIGCLTLPHAATFAQRRRARIDSIPFGQQVGIGRAEPGDARRRQ